MKLSSPQKLILTEEEKNILSKARDILEEIADKMDRAIFVPWSHFDDDEVLGACEIIEDFLD